MINISHTTKNKFKKQFFKLLTRTTLILITLCATGCVMCGIPPNAGISFGGVCIPGNGLRNQQTLSKLEKSTNPSDLKIVAKNNFPGQSTAFTGSAFIPAGSMQNYETIVRFPPAFIVNQNGFSDISPVGTNIGRYEIDINDDGMAEAVFPIISESDFFAWMDINGNNIKDFAEPEIFQSQDVQGNSLLVVTVPNGGDNNPTNNNGNINFKMSIHLDSGLFINPMTTSTSHLITASFQSVDPDTGDFNNGSGAEPEFFDLETTLVIDLIFKSDFE